MPESFPNPGDQLRLLADVPSLGEADDVVVVTCVHPDAGTFCVCSPSRTRDAIDSSPQMLTEFWYRNYDASRITGSNRFFININSSGTPVCRRILGRRNITALPIP